jgi:hypothetical protein
MYKDRERERERERCGLSNSLLSQQRDLKIEKSQDFAII